MDLRSLLFSLILLLSNFLSTLQDLSSLPPDEHAPDASQLLIEAGIEKEEISNETSIEGKEEEKSTERPRIQLRKMATLPPSCKKYSEQEKYQLLSKHGGLNQRVTGRDS
ncbi:hypothetical protein PMAYCL1PPCAC_29408, partial [Pristionchus mayeri]